MHIQEETRRRKGSHLTQSDRDRMEALLESGHMQKEVASILKVNPSTISRERKRQKKNGHYDATTAQHKAQVKRSRSKYQGMKIEKYPELREHIIEGLKDKRSPDEIAGRMKLDNVYPRVGTNAIYKWLYSVWGQPYCRYLCTKRYKRKKQKRTTTRVMIPDRIPLKQRPLEGIHAEGDLFVSPRNSGSKHCGALICVPDTQLIVGTKIRNKKTATMTRAVHNITSHIAIDDLTLDNGIENRDHTSFGIPTYFADPFSPWQKPHVENNIGLLRRWFIPKKTNLSHISEYQLQEYLHILNSKYRKSLGYRSAYELSLERGIILKIPDSRQVPLIN